MIEIIEDIAYKKRLSTVNYCKVKNYITDKMKSKIFRQYIVKNSDYLRQGFGRESLNTYSALLYQTDVKIILTLLRNCVLQNKKTVNFGHIVEK